jgi:hyperosmotically inducible protein
MKKWMAFMAMVLLMAFAQQSCKSKPKDADLQKAATEAVAKVPDAGPTPMISVQNGVATLTGEVKDENAKAAFATAVANVKGITEVNNQLSIAPPPMPEPAPVTITPDDPLNKGVSDLLKDYPTVKAEVKDGVITLTGTLKKSDQQKVWIGLNALKPKKIENKLTIK